MDTTITPEYTEIIHPKGLSVPCLIDKTTENQRIGMYVLSHKTQLPDCMRVSLKQGFKYISLDSCDGDRIYCESNKKSLTGINHIKSN